MAKGAPYDFILIDGAVEQVPQAIVDQVADGGRDRAGPDRRTASPGSAIGRVVSGAFGATAFADAAAAVLPGFAEAPRFQLLTDGVV